MSLFGWAWGEVPTWLAFGAASVAATATWRTLVRQRQGDTERVEKAKRDQANTVTAWLLNNNYQHQQNIRDGTYDRPDWIVHIRNGSEQPVYAVEYHVATSDLPQGQVGGGVLVLVPPHSEGDYAPRSATAQWADIRGNAGVVLVFTDAAGIRWKRGKSGLLTETALGPQQISS